MTKDEVAAVRGWFLNGMTVKEIAEMTGVPRTEVLKIIKDLEKNVRR